MASKNLHAGTRFRYAALADPTEHIRLIEVHQPTGPSHTPSISIFETAVRNPPAEYIVPTYDAVSYTWGDAKEEEHIQVRDRTAGNDDAIEVLPVRKNCVNVLRQLTHFATSRYYWIDAICINQLDVEEREKQVSLMSYIFGQARCVLACVGMHENDSAFLARTMASFDSFLVAGETTGAIPAIRANPSGRLAWTINNSLGDIQQADGIRSCSKWIAKMDTPTFERFFRALDQFAHRAYFWRIWILQELCLASQIRFFCGDSELQLSTLLFWWKDARIITLHHPIPAGGLTEAARMARLILSKLGPTYHVEALWKDPYYFYEHGGSGLGSAFEDMLYERQAVRSNAQSFNRRLMAIPDILKMCEYRQCQDSRDCVFGTLALGNWRPSVSLCKGGHHVNIGDVVTPDYSVSAFSLAKMLLPGSHDVPQLNRLVMGMLGLRHSDEEIQSGLKVRTNAVPDFRSLQKMPPRQINNHAQELVHIVEGGVQLLPESSWSVRRHRIASHQYTQVLDSNDRCCAVATVPIEPGDWLVPTHHGRGFVLRQWGNLYAIVGKAYCPPDLWLHELEYTAFMMWYDPDDLLVHLVGGLRGLTADEIDPPSVELIEHLNVGLCASENSSFGQLPVRSRTWPVSEFAFDPLRKCETMVRDCYEDNKHYWFI